VVWDSRSYETEAPSNSGSEDKGGFEDESEVSHMYPDHPTSRGQVLNCSFSSTASDEEDFFRVGQVNRSKHHPLHTPLALTNEHKSFGIKIYKLCDKTGYSYNIDNLFFP